MCFAMWFDPKVTVNRLAEVSMLLHLTFFVFFFFFSGEVSENPGRTSTNLSYRLLVEPCSEGQQKH